MFDRTVIANSIKEARPHQLMVAFAVLFLVVSGISVYSQSRIANVPEITTAIENSVVGPRLTEAEPIQIRIPKINVKANFEESLGVTETREIEVPVGYETVGYYKYGPTPGELGPAVVLGHVDSVDGPAVFYSLGQLEVGDEIEIDREDGTTAVFEVTNLERHLQAGFPTEQVYGNIDHAGLRLITCSGTFDKGIQRYSHNLIVFAKLKGE